MTTLVARLDSWHVIQSCSFFPLALLYLDPNPLWLEWPEQLWSVLVVALPASVADKHRCFWTKLKKDTRNIQNFKHWYFCLNPQPPSKIKKRIFFKKVCFLEDSLDVQKVDSREEAFSSPILDVVTSTHTVYCHRWELQVIFWFEIITPNSCCVADDLSSL